MGSHWATSRLRSIVQAGFDACLGEQGIELLLENQPEAELGDMRAVALAVVQHEAPSLKMTSQRDKTDLGSVRLPREHRLSEKHLADRHPVKSPDKIARSVPHFDGMSVARVMQRLVGLL